MNIIYTKDAPAAKPASEAIHKTTTKISEGCLKRDTRDRL